MNYTDNFPSATSGTLTVAAEDQEEIRGYTLISNTHYGAYVANYVNHSSLTFGKRKDQLQNNVI